MLAETFLNVRIVFLKEEKQKMRFEPTIDMSNISIISSQGSLHLQSCTFKTM